MHLLEDKVPDDRSCRHDEQHSEKVNYSSQCRDHTEAEKVLTDDLPGLLCRSAKWCPFQCHLDVRVLGQEPDELLQAPDNVLQDPENAGHAPVLLGLRLPFQVQHAVPDELHHSKDEGTEGQGSCVKAKRVVNRPHEHVHLSLLAVGREKPDADSASNGALAQGDEKRVVPQIHKEGDEETHVKDVPGRRTSPALRVRHSASLVPVGETRRPLVRAPSRLVCRAVGLRIGIECPLRDVPVWHLRQQEAGGGHPGKCPDDAEDGLHNGHQDALGRVRQEVGGNLVQLDGQTDP
mmetsp:Transcript_46433/g.132347  ORF Transcript_46433/g.132347 Transcript_46433/m.132347 type:complete len:292 (+) Transcript_46433:338-1213(+)